MSKLDPIPPNLHDPMNKLARMLDELFKPYGFALLVFDFGDNARMNYISNAKREDMLVAMREFIAKHEGRAPGKGGTA